MKSKDKKKHYWCIKQEVSILYEKLDIDNVTVPLTYILIKTIHFLANVFYISFIAGIAPDRQL